jgi:hypothetical protein
MPSRSTRPVGIPAPGLDRTDVPDHEDTYPGQKPAERLGFSMDFAYANRYCSIVQWLAEDISS